MKFNVEKLKAVARPMTNEERAAMDYRAENADWLQLSATIALKIRKLLRQQGMTQVDLADRLGVTPPQVSKLLSGKINFELKTLAGIQKALGKTIIDVSLQDELPGSEQIIKTQVVLVTQYIKSAPILSNPRFGSESVFTNFKPVG